MVFHLAQRLLRQLFSAIRDGNYNRINVVSLCRVES